MRQITDTHSNHPPRPAPIHAAPLIGAIILLLMSILSTPVHALDHTQGANPDSSPEEPAGTDTIWSQIAQGQHVILLRHALAPGTGDPANFELRDCSTQRNLSDEGREQARRIGEMLRQNGLTDTAIYSSQWCRCLETARLLDLEQPVELPALNSFFRNYEKRSSQTRELTQWLDGQNLARPLVLVTHQVNITAFTGIFPGSGELVIVRRNGSDYDVVRTIPTR